MKYMLIIIYIFISSISILFSLSGYDNIGVIITPIIPILLILYIYKDKSSFLDYRVFYEFAIFIWSIGKSVSIFTSFNNSYDLGSFSIIYIFAMISAPLLVLFFKNHDYYSKLILISNKKYNRNILMGEFTLWILLTLGMFFVAIDNQADMFVFVLKQLMQGLQIIISGVLINNLLRIKNIYSGTMLIAVIFFTIYINSIQTIGRTAILLPFF